MKITKSKVITVTSVKGGVGKTTFVLALAAQYKMHDKKVLIVDMDLFSGDIETLLNKESKKDIYILFEDILNNNFYDVDSYITKYDDNIDFIAAPKDPRYASKVNGNFLNLLISRVGTKYDVILIDTNHFLNEVNLVTFDNSNEIVYLMNNNCTNLKNMRTMISILADMHMENYKIVLYEAKDKRKNVFRKFDIKSMIKENINYIIDQNFYIKDIDKYIIDDKIFSVLNKYIKNTNSKVFDKIARDLIK